jgi:hypothetical protein
VHDPLDELTNLRNRIAHHEPIFRRDLEKDFESIINVTSWICPETSAWMRHHSRMAELLTYDPKNGGVKF